MFFKDVRSLKISSAFVRAQFKKSFKPKLILTGDWMKEAGFAIGEKVTVTIFENKLIITKDGSNN